MEIMMEEIIGGGIPDPGVLEAKGMKRVVISNGDGAEGQRSIADGEGPEWDRLADHLSDETILGVIGVAGRGETEEILKGFVGEDWAWDVVPEELSGIAVGDRLEGTVDIQIKKVLDTDGISALIKDHHSEGGCRGGRGDPLGELRIPGGEVLNGDDQETGAA